MKRSGNVQITFHGLLRDMEPGSLFRETTLKVMHMLPLSRRYVSNSFLVSQETTPGYCFPCRYASVLKGGSVRYGWGLYEANAGHPDGD
jgi:hypothetical protein